MTLLKIFRASEWQAFEADKRFDGSADDLRDGFIHLSTPEQVQGTLDRHFANETGLIIAEVGLANDPALRLEPSRGGALFPHLYRSLLSTDIADWKPAT